MKVLSGLIYHESNTFNPLPTGVEQFSVIDGEPSLDRLASTKVFRDYGVEVVPTVYAMALSSGVVELDVYETFKQKMLKVAATETDLDGVWLHLHGAMIVEGVGCAEVDLLRSLRHQLGADIPIAVTLDPHGNITPELASLASTIRAYRTIPHTDQAEVETRTALELIELMKGRPGRIGYAQVPLVLSGEQALSTDAPLNEILAELDRVESQPGIMDASFFVGFAWADVPWNSGSVLVVPTDKEHSAFAQAEAERLSQYILDRADQFVFRMPLLSIDETVDRIVEGQDEPLFVADSGDNTTGGAVGANTVLLRRILESVPSQRVCVTTIFDREAVHGLESVAEGEEIRVNVGMGLTPESAPVVVQGTLKSKGNLLGYMRSEKDVVGRAYTVTSGNVDVVITDISGSFVTPRHFTEAGLNLDDYDVVVLKQGYLFPQLAARNRDYFMSVTPGGTYQLLEELKFENTSLPSTMGKGK